LIMLQYKKDGIKMKLLLEIYLITAWKLKNVAKIFCWYIIKIRSVFFNIFFINVGVRVSLRTLRLILRSWN
jgi:hypothetical protein